MKILSVNTGSSSVRLAAFINSGSVPKKLADRHIKLNESTPEAILRAFVNESNFKDVQCIAHRVVHGGTKLLQPCLINSEIENEINRLSPMAPLHNPSALKWIRICRELFGQNVPQVAVFDTAFYSQMPEVAKTYALPRDICIEHGIRRYGFHGLAHSAMLQRWQGIRPDIKYGGRVISLQLGAGCSITSIRDGKAVDTSMGFSPLEGLVMATRSGDIDPEILLFLQKSGGLTADEIHKMLSESSGLLGLSGISNDMRVLLESDAPEARLAIDLYCYRARKYIGSYLSVLNGADVILFGGGVGENASLIRERILHDMKWCGIELDRRINNDTIGIEGRITSSSSKIEAWVISVDEAAVLAKEAFTVIGGLNE
ncbi:MAG: acetate/propionate family kinase [Thermodesulfovibrionia bacterium]|nr:acetate/propionate family kinase [Thermodesulfovibrionia bacterium]